MTPISASNTSAVTVVPANPNRRLLYIRNYVDATLNAGAVTMWVAFGQTATQGTNGEYELVNGGEYPWNGPLPPLVGNVPTEFISIITNTGSAKGCVIEIS